MTKRSGSLYRIKSVGLAALLATVSATSSHAVDLSLGQQPLFLGGGVPPNIVFTLDDSGSMAWSYMPDTIAAYFGRPQGLNYEFNTLAYNPNVTYTPPVTYDASGNKIVLPPASFTAALDDGYAAYLGTLPSDCPTVDLSSDYRPTWDFADGRGQYSCDAINDWFTEARGTLPEYWGAAASSTSLPAGQRAFYYVYNTLLAGTGGCPDPADPSIDQCYGKVEIPNEVAKEQNFANWYSYYRKRTMLAKAGISQAFADVAEDSRVGFGRINSPSGGGSGEVNATTTLRLGVRPFIGADRQKFYDELYRSPANGSTPLRRSVYDVGNYFLRSDTLGPWDETPGSDATADLYKSRCRQSYHILMSDGYWNEDVPTIGNIDGANFNNYVKSDPFQDGVSDTLADFAMKYWATDLLATTDNLVPPNAVDDANWQHLVTFSVGLGLSGLQVIPTDAFAAIATKTQVTKKDGTKGWPSPFDNIKYPDARLDDLLHAAVNSRGAFLQANDAKSFKDALSQALRDISERSGSAASVVLNSAALQTDSALFQAKFYSPDWYGSLLAYEILPNGNLNPTPLWDANAKIPDHAKRNIMTYNGTKGVPFMWVGAPTVDTMSAAQLSAIGSEEVLNYLRGARTLEGTTTGGIAYRERKSVLGDIVNSAPVYVAAPTASYRDVWIEGLDPDNVDKKAPENASDAQTYSAFRLSNGVANRAPRVYVGANDGMLHAFDASATTAGGAEVFAFVPSKVISNLKNLANRTYAHQYFVDGTPSVGDVFWGKTWKTVLVGGLGGGGRSIYALDITDASSIKVLWEFTDVNTAASGKPNGHPDLGFTYSRPNIVRLANDKWVAIFGNGYNNSGSKQAALFIVDLETGRLVTDAPITATATDPVSPSRTNGLATVAPVDIDGDFTVDYVYGGDLYGNLWKFDLTSAKPSDWEKASSRTLLFKAVSEATNEPQSITTRPQVMRHPVLVDNKRTTLVLFGTGKYLEPTVDNTQDGQVTQTFYGVWDDGESNYTTITRSVMQKQEILGEGAGSDGNVYRVTTDNDVVWIDAQKNIQKRGWYLDLLDTENNNTKNFGERQVSDSLIRNGRVIFTTLIPSADPCSFGGEGWLMELNAVTGGRTAFTVFDATGDGLFGQADYIDYDGASGAAVAAAPSGRKSTVGIVPTPAILSREGGGMEYKYQPGAKSGVIEVVKENPGPGDFGRNSWIQLFK